MGFGVGNESKRANRNPLKVVTCNLLPVFFFGVLSPVIINTAFLIREKIINSGDDR